MKRMEGLLVVECRVRGWRWSEDGVVSVGVRDGRVGLVWPGLVPAGVVGRGVDVVPLGGVGLGDGCRGGAGLVPDSADRGLVGEVVAQLEAYCAGRLWAFSLPLEVAGSAFDGAVREVLMGIGCGERRGYGWVAAVLGRPGAARAVGGACGRNLLGLVVPCHRVVGGDGSLGGYRWGVGLKGALLEFEGGMAGGGS